jgi:hypothetical protein
MELNILKLCKAVFSVPPFYRQKHHVSCYKVVASAKFSSNVLLLLKLGG